MASKSYLLWELDPRTREYLGEVRKSGGQDMAGIYLSSGPPHATWAFPLTGIIILGIVMCMVFPPLNDPTHQAMLLTAGLLLGGWLILAGFRIIIAQAMGRTMGTFTYADPKQLWVVDYSVVQRWPLKSLQSVTVEGTNLSLEYPDGVEKVAVPFETGILEIATYLDYWLQARGEGAHDQALIESHAAGARAAAYDEDPEDQPRFSLEIPIPKPDENARGYTTDWPILLGILVFAIMLYVVVYWVILFWHDYAVFNYVRNQSPTHWRAYLVDPRHTLYRDRIKQMLRERYQQKSEQLKAQILARNVADLQGSDEAMAQLLMMLAEAPQPVVTLRVHDTTDEKDRVRFPPINQGAGLQNFAQNEITNGLFSAIGQDMISLVQPPDDVPALLDIQSKFAVENNQPRIEWVVTIRKNPDSEPIYQKNWSKNFQEGFQAEPVYREEIRRIKNALTGMDP